ncbi:hypothetical protein NC653_024412 [Populus alba x Populus x berolinensis]|uniref:Uncharacterized protein n=1 Tax=Populus alba x Populus x berolinensis TaxID=444605 RepID=A0AAD6M994_9ROSI|nr:hypothetical protein NC653_024412 [Populus alba x Populus x berolinensis]
MDGHDADDAKKSTADMTAFWMEFMVRVNECLALADRLHCFSAGAKFASADGCLYEKGQFHYYLSSLVLIMGISLHFCEMAFVRSPLEFYDLKSDVAVSIWDSRQKSSLIDELEQSINDLRTEMGVEGSPSPSVPPKVKEEPKPGDDSA